MLILLSISVLTLVFDIQPVRASRPTVHHIGQNKDSATIDEMVLDWYRTYDFSTDTDVARAVTVDSENNIIVVGFDRSVDSGQWRIMKLDNEGNELPSWPYIYNRTDYWDEPRSVAADSLNNIIVVGRRGSSGPDTNWEILKLDENANLIWAKSEDFLGEASEAMDVVVDKSDNSIIVVGFDEGSGTGNWRIIKYDSTATGTELWNKTFTDSGTGVAFGVAVQLDRSIIVVGSERVGAGNYDWRIRKLDPDTGDVIPACDKIILSTPDYDMPFDVAVDSNDNIIVVGYEGVARPNTKWKIIKLDPNCNEIGSWDGDWSPRQDSARSVAVDSYDNIIVVGYDQNPGKDMKWRIMKFSSDTPLTLLWEDTVNPTVSAPEKLNLESANGVAVLEGVNIIVVGSDDSPTADHHRKWRIMKFAYTYAREIHDLIETIETWDLSKGAESSLTARLASVIHQLIKRNENVAINKLTVLMSQIEALRGKKLTNDHANYLIAEAQRIKNLIEG